MIKKIVYLSLVISILLFSGCVLNFSAEEIKEKIIDANTNNLESYIGILTITSQRDAIKSESEFLEQDMSIRRNIINIIMEDIKILFISFPIMMLFKYLG